MVDDNQREWQRVKVDLAVRCRALDGPARYEMMRIVDMHQQGCCLQGHMHFEKGQTVRVIVQIPFEGEVYITGEVVWAGFVDDTDDQRTGLRFLIDDPIAEETSMKLFHYCLLRQPKE